MHRRFSQKLGGIFLWIRPFAQNWHYQASGLCRRWSKWPAYHFQWPSKVAYGCQRGPGTLLVQPKTETLNSGCCCLRDLLLQELSPWGWQAYDAEFRERMQAQSRSCMKLEIEDKLDVKNCKNMKVSKSSPLKGREETVCHEWIAG